jgi:23S rRNA (cytidine1920-2'-O)/16S rRNA (cytidine1409-2'-O)-methyltransferase
VVVCDETNIRDLEHLDLMQRNGLSAIFVDRFDLIVADLSFISLKSVAKAFVARAAKPSQLVLLVKPQFEASRQEVDKGAGIIRDSAIHDRVQREVGDLYASLGCTVRGVVESPIKGAQGNIEFLMCLDIG